MPIRREDKEFVQALSLMGALFGACIGMFAVIHLSDLAKETHTEQTEYTQTQAALIKLKTSVVNPSNPISNENVLDQVQQRIPQKPASEAAPQKSFWIDIPRWGYIGLCGGGVIAGAIVGYNFIWLIGWIGSILVLYFIRGVYRAIGKVTPHSAAAGKTQANPDNAASSYAYHQRNEDRMLPMLVKLLFLLAFVLTVTAAIVWRLTAP